MATLEAERSMSEQPADVDVAAPPPGSVTERVLRIVVPVTMLLLLLVAWQVYVTVNNVPHYILPSPLRVAQAMATDWPILFAALWVTLKITFSALAIALAGGVAASRSPSSWHSRAGSSSRSIPMR
jgi:NitT/TauT family transport system permease protein